MPWVPSSDRALELAERAAALVRDCRGLPALGWPEAMLDRCADDAEHLTDGFAAHGQADLRERALDLYAILGDVQEASRPTPAHAAELARATGRLAEALPHGAATPIVDVLSSGGPTPTAFARSLEAQGWTLRRHPDVEAMAAAAQRTPAAALLVDAALLPVAMATLDLLASQVPAAAATAIVALGPAAGDAQLKAMLQGAEHHATGLDDPALPARLAEFAHGATDAPYRVLVVDDDANSRAYLRVLLQQAGIDALECDDAREVVARVAAEQPDLLLVDLYMPGMDGLELTRELRRQPGLSLLPILFVSGEEREQARSQAIQAGADDYLRKPVRPRTLLSAVRSRIRRARRVQRQFPSLSPSAPLVRRGGQLRRGDFLAQLADAQRAPRAEWQVLLALKVDQAAELAGGLGLAGGFELEQAIAARFAALLAPEDAYTLWLEFGFGVLVHRDRAEAVTELATALCQAVAGTPFQVQGEPRTLTLSVGLALPPTGEGAGNPDRWFAAAYAGMSIAHRLGGDRFDGVLTRRHGDMPAERVLIIREFVKNAARGEHVVIEFQPMLPLRGQHGGQYALVTKLRDFRAPLAGIRRDEYLEAARDAGAVTMIERIGVLAAFEAIEEERARGRTTRVSIPLDVASLDAAQLGWIAAELRRRRAIAEGLVIEVDASELLARPGMADVLWKLKSCDVTLSLSEPSGSLSRLDPLFDLPGDLLRLPHAAVEGIDPAVFGDLLAPWRARGRGVIVDHVRGLDAVSRLWDLGVDYLQGDALAAAGPRLDFDFAG